MRVVDPYQEEVEYLYHVSAFDALDSILAEGLHECSYWCTDGLVDYYQETIEDEGRTPIVLRMEISAVAELLPEPDDNSIAEPISTCLPLSEGEVHLAWSAAEGTWQDALAIVGSIRLRAPVPASLLVLDED